MLQVLSLVLKNEEKPAKPQRAGILHCLMYNQAPSAPRTAGSSSVNEPGPPAAPLAEEKIIQSIIETQRGWAGRDLKAPAPAVGLSPPPPHPPQIRLPRAPYHGLGHPQMGQSSPLVVSAHSCLSSHAAPPSGKVPAGLTAPTPASAGPVPACPRAAVLRAAGFAQGLRVPGSNAHYGTEQLQRG